MTEAEIVSNGIATLGLVVALASAAIAGFALRRTAEAENREREAIVVVRNVWSGTPGIDDSIIPGMRGRATQLIQPNPESAAAEQQLVIAMESRNRSVLVRQSDEDVVLELRTATPSDLADHDGPGGRNTYYVMLEITNVGRWAATGVRIHCTLDGTFLAEFDEGTIDRSFVNQMIEFEALAANSARYVRIRNMTGLPVTLDFAGISVDNDQRIRFAPTSPVLFEPRGYRS